MRKSCYVVVVLKSFEIKTGFITGYHAHTSILAPAKIEQLHVAMQATNAIDKYVVPVKRKESQVVGHLPLRKSRKFEKTVFKKKIFKSQ